MATTLSTFLDKQWISDFLKWEMDQRLSRKVVTVGTSQTLVKGQVVANSGAGINDVQVFTLAGTIASGTLMFQYGSAAPGQLVGLRTAALAGTGITAATIQTALRALGVSAGDAALALCTVALTVAAAGVDTAVYTVTSTTQYVPALQVVENGCLTAGAVACTLGSSGQAPGTSATATDPNYAAATILNVGAHTAGASPNNIVVLPAATGQVVTLTVTTAAAAGTFQLRINNTWTTTLNYNDATATVQAAVDVALGAGKCTVSGAANGLSAGAQNIILTFASADPVSVEYLLLTAHTSMVPLKPLITFTAPASVAGIMLQDVTTTSSMPKTAIIVSRLALVDANQLTYGANVTTAAQKAAVLAALENQHVSARAEAGANSTTVQYT